MWVEQLQIPSVPSLIVICLYEFSFMRAFKVIRNDIIFIARFMTSFSWPGSLVFSYVK